MATITTSQDPRFGRTAEPEFKNLSFTCDLLNEREENYTVQVEVEGYRYNGEFRIVHLEIVGDVCKYTKGDVEEVLRERLGKVFLDCVPVLKTK